MLVAAEVLIVGMAIYAVGHGGTGFGAGMRRVDFTGASFAPLAAGATPHVVIDDAVSRVHVAASSDGLVHVRDLTQVRGALFSSANYAQLRVTRTADGVRIERPHAESLTVDVFGISVQSIEVDVPQGARVEIARCAGADVYGVAGGVSVHSLDGHVTLTDLQGSIDAHSDDGYLEVTNVHGDHLALDSSDGHLALQNVSVASLVGTTRDGRIEADGLNVTGNATLQTDDGSVRARFAPGASLTVDASTSDGSISVDGSSLGHDDSAQRTIRVGAGAGRMKLATDDGSIHIFTNGDSQSDGL
jgi:DUF4097 and DUF4098 domain-containing protein YvlB